LGCNITIRIFSISEQGIFIQHGFMLMVI